MNHRSTAMPTGGHCECSPLPPLQPCLQGAEVRAPPPTAAGPSEHASSEAQSPPVHTEHDFQATNSWDYAIYIFARKLSEKTMPRAVLLTIFSEPLNKFKFDLRPASPSFHLTVSAPPSLLPGSRLKKGRGCTFGGMARQYRRGDCHVR